MIGFEVDMLEVGPMLPKLGGMVCLAILLPWFPCMAAAPQPGDVNRATYEKIYPGMTRQEVVALIGRGPDCSSDKVLSAEDVWVCGNATITITYAPGKSPPMVLAVCWVEATVSHSNQRATLMPPTTDANPAPQTAEIPKVDLNNAGQTILVWHDEDVEIKAKPEHPTEEELRLAIKAFEPLQGTFSDRSNSPNEILLVFATHSATDEQLKKIPQLPFPFGLNLGFSRITDLGAKDLRKLTNLSTLALDLTQVTDAGLREIAQIASLTELSLADSKVTDVGLKEIAKLTALTSLCLRGTDVTDAGMKEIAKLSKLCKLDLSDTQVTDAGLKELAKLPKLSSLMLTHTEVTDAGAKELVNLKGLSTLWLDDTQVTDAGVKEIAKLKILTTLVLDNTQVTDVGLSYLVDAKALFSINLSETKVSDAGLKRFNDSLPGCCIIRGQSFGEPIYVHNRKAD